MMAELTLVDIGLFALALLIGLIVGWIWRAGRCAREKIAVNAGWQSQMDSQQSEHDRLAGQNKSLMEQISQNQASSKDSNMRAKELSDSLKEAFARRDELQRQIKEIRGNLEIAVAQRERLQADVQSHEAKGDAADSELRKKEEKISKLGRDLKTWQDRVPPLVERFRERDQHARALEEQLEQSRERVEALEKMIGTEHTHIEPIDAAALPGGLDASNEPHADTAAHEISSLDDQVTDGPDEPVGGQETEIKSEIDLGSPEDDDSSGDAVDANADQDTTADAGTSDTELNWWDEIDEADDKPTAEFAQGLNDDKEEGPTNGNSSGDARSAADSRDDLKQIKGVGPAIEKTLNDLGIYRFNQIAEMSEYDIDRVAQQLKGFRSRVYREDWIGQARALQYQKFNDPG